MRIISLRKCILILTVFCLLIFLSSCMSAQMLSYYSDEGNYVRASGTITYIAYNEDGTALYLNFSELTPGFSDTCFKIVGENLLIIQENGIDEKLQVGDCVDFISAPRYFGDGYVMPIVALSADDEVFLAYDDSVANLLKWLESR